MFLPNARTKELEGQLTTITAERDNLTAQVTALTAERDQLAEANRQCEERHTADQTAITTLTTERDAALARATAAETGTEAEVTRRIAAAGIDPIKRDPKAAVDTSAASKGGNARERLAAHFNTHFQK